jgi:hypothetical protein
MSAAASPRGSRTALVEGSASTSPVRRCRCTRRARRSAPSAPPSKRNIVRISQR